ncbi:DUF6578 domain-containing protein [Streptomyces sp. NPDC006446]|uniref:DUF6578 domain-containing protein n=1 Tax=Streptomyces sp. NPDC006446 TaxID=3154301 RepID=UPI0033A2580D
MGRRRVWHGYRTTDPGTERDPTPAEGSGGPVRPPASGTVPGERHGARWPGTTGTVRTIHLVHQDFPETAPGSRTWVPVPASRSPAAADSGPRALGDGRAGVLAELELHVPDPRT